MIALKHVKHSAIDVGDIVVVGGGGGGGGSGGGGRDGTDTLGNGL